MGIYFIGPEHNAARVTDNHVCKHGAGPILTGSPNVKTNNLDAARMSDKAQCPSGPDYIVTGSFTVRINGKYAARITSKSMHSGEVKAGSGNVMIGGPEVGGSLGHADEARKKCEELAKGRQSGKTQQSYSNCGIESSRLVIHQATGSNITEDQLLNQSLDNGNASGRYFFGLLDHPRNTEGGAMPNQQSNILNQNGVPSQTMPANMDNVEQAVADGDGVVTSHNAGQLWGGEFGQVPTDAGHAVSPTGLNFGPDGQLASVDTADSGAGNCDRRVPASDFSKSLTQYSQSVKTNKPIW